MTFNNLRGRNTQKSRSNHFLSLSVLWRLFSVVALLLVQGLFINVQPAEAQPAPDPAPAPVMETGQPRPLFAAVPALSLNVPSTVMLGEEFTFTATFDSSGDTGYGPFIDLIFPATGIDGVDEGAFDTTPTNDGVSFIGASFMGIAIPSDQLFVTTFPDNDGTGPGLTGCVAHPIAVRPAGGVDGHGGSSIEIPRYYDVCGTAGDEFVTIILPFGSFVASQPAADVTITAQMSDLADLNAPLDIRGHASFRYGNTPINDFCCNPWDATIPVDGDGEYAVVDGDFPVTASIEPALLTLTKAYVGPEGETSTGPNFPRQFTITVDIADGQTLGIAGDGAQNFVITDILPDNIQYLSLDGSSPAGAVCTTTPTDPLVAPGGTLTCTIDSVLGGAGTDDATLTFSYFVDRLDAGSSDVVDPDTGAPATSGNTASVAGVWEPLDTRDPNENATGTCGTPCVGVEDQSIVVQKGVSNITDSNNTPWDVLEYTLDFQISDFFGFEAINLTDIFSDGQRFDTSFAPTITLNGNGGNDISPASAMGAANVDIACNYTGATAPSADCDTIDPAANDGQTTIVFNVSDEVISQFANRQLLGGCVDPTIANNPPDCGTYNNGGTTGTITFRTIIQDVFSDDYPSGDPSVDHGDILGNDVDITGNVLNIAEAPVGGIFVNTTGGVPIDDSSAGVTIAFGGLVKSIYAVNGSTTLPEYLSPSDEITYRLTYTQPTSDFEETVFTDFLPLPVFSATELGASGNLTDQTCVDLGYTDDVPPAGQFCLMDAATDAAVYDTYHLLNDPPVNEPNPIVTATYVVPPQVKMEFLASKIRHFPSPQPKL